MRITITLCLLAILTTLTTPGMADEIVIDRNFVSKHSVGNFECSNCPTNSSPKLGLNLGTNGLELSTGKVWQFLNHQGITSADKLTLCLDLDSLDSESEFSLYAVELNIESPDETNTLLNNFNLGDNSLLVPGYETSSFKPEVKLEALLGYDFMDRFSATSQEKINVVFKSNSDIFTSPPKIYVQSDSSSGIAFGNNLVTLVGFALFWVGLFLLLNRFTKPSDAVVDLQPTTTPSVALEPNLALARVKSREAISA
ncbi:MAG: hypothetical protein P8J27_13875 [Mariniblastus sp.]|nr:hypothetical protein [Mariniblastus sp.]